MCMFTSYKSQVSIIKKETQKSICKKGSSGSSHCYHLHKNTCAFYLKTEVPVQRHRSAQINQATASSLRVNHTVVSHQDDLKGKRSNKVEFSLDNAEVKNRSLPHPIARPGGSPAAPSSENSFIYLMPQHAIACVHMLYNRKE